MQYISKLDQLESKMAQSIQLRKDTHKALFNKLQQNMGGKWVTGADSTSGIVNSCSSVDEYEEIGAGSAGPDGARSTMYEESILDQQMRGSLHKKVWIRPSELVQSIEAGGSRPILVSAIEN